MKDALMDNIGVLLSAMATGFAGWFFGRKKAKTEYENGQIENAEKLLSYYKNLVDDLGIRLQKSIEELKAATMNIRSLEDKVEELTSELRKYKQLNGKAKE